MAITETTQSGVSAPASAEDQFQSLFDAGAFEPEAPEVPRNEKGQFAPEEAKPAEAPEASEAQAKAPEAQNATEEQPEEYSALDELLAAKGIDPESALSLPVKVKIDGVEKSVPLAEVLKSYQLEGHVNNKSIELSNAQKSFLAEQEAARQLVGQQLRHVQNLGELARNQLNYEFQQIDWKTLQATDPGRYAALYVDFQQRNQQIDHYLGQVNAQYAAAEQQSQAALAAKLQSEQEAMMAKHPEWRDQAAFASASSEMMTYAKSLGFSDAELSQVYDHRLMEVLHDAASYRNLQAAKPDALKRVREAPKMAKPGTRNVTDPKEAQRKALVERFNANPHDVDAQAALFGLFV